MAAVSKPFETNVDSKEIALGKKISEIKKRLVLAGMFIILPFSIMTINENVCLN